MIIRLEATKFFLELHHLEFATAEEEETLSE